MLNIFNYPCVRIYSTVSCVIVIFPIIHSCFKGTIRQRLTIKTFVAFTTTVTTVIANASAKNGDFVDMCCVDLSFHISYFGFTCMCSVSIIHASVFD